jgi:hypothetical protein
MKKRRRCWERKSSGMSSKNVDSRTSEDLRARSGRSGREGKGLNDRSRSQRMQPNSVALA